MFRHDAEHILETAQKVVGALDEAKEAQDKAEGAVQKADKNIDQATRDLTQVSCVYKSEVKLFYGVQTDNEHRYSVQT